jgi:two-component system nitrogen regulation response regulator NtrX
MSLDSVKKILVVDDEADIREILCEILTAEMKVEILQASNGQEALSFLNSDKFDAIFCDYRMPIMNGKEFLDKANEVGNLTPFIFVTGFPDDETFLEVLRGGAFGFIEKPFKAKEIVDTLTHAVRLAKERAESLSS